MLEDLIAVAPEDRKRPLHRQLELLAAAAHERFGPEDGAWAMEPDQQGLGSARTGILQ